MLVVVAVAKRCHSGARGNFGNDRDAGGGIRTPPETNWRHQSLCTWLQYTVVPESRATAQTLVALSVLARPNGDLWPGSTPYKPAYNVEENFLAI